MYTNIENMVYRIFQNYYDISINDMSRNILNNLNNSRQHSTISSTNISILMESIFDVSYQDTLNDISFIAYRFLSNSYAPTNSYAPISYLNNNYTPDIYVPNNYVPNNYLYNRSYNVRRYSLMDLMRTLSQNNTIEENSFLENFINSTFDNNEEKFKKVISNYELEKLKPQNFIKENEIETNCQCPIFCYNFEENEQIIKLPCNHNFNCEGIIKWLTEESNTCPVCRYEFDYKEINTDNKRQDIQDIQEDINEDEDNNNENENEELENDDYFTQSDNNYNTNIYNIISEDEIFMQEILLYAYSNNNNNN